MDTVSFERTGRVSVWVGRKTVEPGSDFLRELFGVEYYDPDDQECIIGEFTSHVGKLAHRLSYSESFIDALIDAANRLGIDSCLWVFAQYDFEYDPVKARINPLPEEPRYIGTFPWYDR
jgi:hypothetical protein